MPSSTPQYASEITAAAKTSFLNSDRWAYTAGIVAILLGGVLVFFCFPKKEEEESLLAQYHAQDSALPAVSAAPSPSKWRRRVETERSAAPGPGRLVACRAWIPAPGAMLDAAALASSTLDGKDIANARLCLQAGVDALQAIAVMFKASRHLGLVPIGLNNMTRAQYDAACAQLASAGALLKQDRDAAWEEFAAYRATYQRAVLALGAYTLTRPSPWFEPVDGGVVTVDRQRADLSAGRPQGH